jgi:thiamine phosphate synthase YjbQ (UPF0047 family)
MQSYRKELWFNIPTRRAFINITSQVEECLRESGIKEGLCLVNAMHITASVFINDDESGLHHDYEKGSKNLHLMSLFLSTIITVQVKTMAMPI